MADQFTDDQISKLKEIFDFRDRDGAVLTILLYQVMFSLGQKPTEEELHDVINEVDAKNFCMVDFPEFLNLMAKKINEIGKDRNGSTSEPEICTKSTEKVTKVDHAPGKVYVLNDPDGLQRMAKIASDFLAGDRLWRKRMQR